ncbi:uncharacterized protein LOC120405988 isoform X8 [Mauremys reevesii]|uniref:uncharacterized protein LOC120405988 isoform X8 n=1 Tax=Mauremys reevesii TaxID=260615 RepID=UPI00193F1531|nr:uncharacterized protein LOC120405988 isoform X8 [Mauremys reevesii]
MAKFLAELLGCTLPDKGTSSMFESRSQSRIGLKQSTKQKTTTFSTLANEKSVSDRKWIYMEDVSLTEMGLPSFRKSDDWKCTV